MDKRNRQHYALITNTIPSDRKEYAVARQILSHEACKQHFEESLNRPLTRLQMRLQSPIEASLKYDVEFFTPATA